MLFNAYIIVYRFISFLETMLCYLHNISQVKTVTETKRKYFNCVLQCDDKPRRGICFSGEKRAEMQAVATTKSPVKIKNFKRASVTLNKIYNDHSS